MCSDDICTRGCRHRDRVTFTPVAIEASGIGLASHFFVKAAPGWTHCPGAPALWAAAAFSPRNSASSQGIVGCARIEFPPIMLMGAAAIAENACRRLPEFRARVQLNSLPISRQGQHQRRAAGADRRRAATQAVRLSLVPALAGAREWGSRPWTGPF